MNKLTILSLLLSSAEVLSMQQVVVLLKQQPKNFLVPVLKRHIREGTWEGFERYKRCLPQLQYAHFGDLRNACEVHKQALSIASTLRENPLIANNLKLLRKEVSQSMPKGPRKITRPAHQRAGYMPPLHRFVQEKLKEIRGAINIQQEGAICRVDALRILELTDTPLWSHVRAIQKTTKSLSEAEMRVYLDVQEDRVVEAERLLEKTKNETYVVEPTADGQGMHIRKRGALLDALLEHFWNEYMKPCNDPACKDANAQEVS